MYEIFLLLEDSDGTLRSRDTPFGVAVTSEKEAKRFVEEDDIGYTRSYEKIVIFDDKDDAIKYAFPTYKPKVDKEK